MKRQVPISLICILIIALDCAGPRPTPTPVPTSIPTSLVSVATTTTPTSLPTATATSSSTPPPTASSTSGSTPSPTATPTSPPTATDTHSPIPHPTDTPIPIPTSTPPTTPTPTPIPPSGPAGEALDVPFVRWEYRSEEGISSSPAVGPDSTIYLGTVGGSLEAIHPDGTSSWVYSIGGEQNAVLSPVIAPEGIIYFITFSGELYALNPDGSLRGRYDLSECVGYFSVMGPDGTLYLAGRRTICAIASDGKVRWSYEADEFISFLTVGPDGGLYYTTWWDNQLHALNAKGNLRWSHQFTSRTSSPVVTGKDGTIYVGVEDGTLQALSPTGEARRVYEAESAILTLAAGDDGTIYAGAATGTLYALSRDGQLIWAFQAGDMVVSPPAIDADGTVYFGAADNRLYAVKRDGTLLWRYSMGCSTPETAVMSSQRTLLIIPAERSRLIALGSEKVVAIPTPEVTAVSLSRPGKELARVRIYYKWLGLGDLLNRLYTVQRTADGAVSDAGIPVEGALLDSLAGALDDLQPSDEMLQVITHFDDYPFFRIEMLYEGGQRVILTSESNDYRHIPWNVIAAEQLYVQCTGQIPRALEALLKPLGFEAGKPMATAFPGRKMTESLGWPAELRDGYLGFVELDMVGGVRHQASAGSGQLRVEFGVEQIGSSTPVDAVTEARIEHQGQSYTCRVEVGAKEQWTKDLSLRCDLSALERQDGEPYRLDLWMAYQSEGQARRTDGVLWGTWQK